MKNITGLIKGQYIDSKGKTQVLLFEDFTLIVSPLAPLSVPNVLDYDIRYTTLENVRKTFHFSVISQVTKSMVKGVWVKPERLIPYIRYAFIPLVDTEVLEDVPETSSFVLKSGRNSLLSQMNDSVLIASYLMNYILYDYSLDPIDPDKISDRITVKGDHNYNFNQIGKRLFKDGNNVMYDNGKLIVRFEETKKRLIAYLKTRLANDLQEVMNYKFKATITEYNSLSDFRQTPEQIVFLDKESLLDWFTLPHSYKHRYRVSSVLLPDSYEPYFFRSPRILNSRLLIIQNVDKENLQIASTICRLWKQRGINYGNSPSEKELFVETGYYVYSENGLVETKEGEIMTTVLRYSEGRYAAILEY